MRRRHQRPVESQFFLFVSALVAGAYGMLGASDAQELRPMPRPAIRSLPEPGVVIEGCEAQPWFDTTPPTSKRSAGPERIALTADLDHANADTDRIWHVVENLRDLSVSFGWRDPNSQRLILKVPHGGKALEEGKSACIMNEGFPGDFAHRSVSEFKVNTTGWTTFNAVFFTPVADSEEDGPRDTSGDQGEGQDRQPIEEDASRPSARSRFLMQRHIAMETADRQWIAAEIEIRPNADGEGSDVLLDHFPPVATMLISERALVEGSGPFSAASENFGTPAVETAPLADFLDAALEQGAPPDLDLEELKEEQFLVVPWSESGYELVGVELGSPDAPVILLDDAGLPALMSSLAFARPAGGED